MTSQASGTARVTLPIGVHARPSLKLARLAKSFESSIRLALDAAGPWVEAKSIATLMRTRMPHGSHVYILAEGRDAREAVQAIVHLVERNFDESPSPLDDHG